MEAERKTQSKLLPVIITICVTLVLITGIGGWVYVQKEQLAQKDQELQQQKQLREKEIEAQKESAKIQADGQRDAARKACQATGKAWFAC